MALLACRAGAAKVYAVEPGDVIQIAREVAAANGFADRICFIQAMTTDIDLPEPVDGIVSEIHGTLPLFQKSLVSILDARHRFLKPGGWTIPARETIWAALAASPDSPQTLCRGVEHRVRLRFLSRRVQSRESVAFAAPEAGRSARGATMLGHAGLRAHTRAQHQRSDLVVDRHNGPSATGSASGSTPRRRLAAAFRTRPPRRNTFFRRASLAGPKQRPCQKATRSTLLCALTSTAPTMCGRGKRAMMDGTAGRVKAHYRQSSFFAQPFGRDRMPQTRTRVRAGSQRRRAHRSADPRTDGP